MGMPSKIMTSEGFTCIIESLVSGEISVKISVPIISADITEICRYFETKYRPEILKYRLDMFLAKIWVFCVFYLSGPC